MSAGVGRPHLPMRPTWLCRVCAANWPCNAARLALLAEFGTHRLALRIYLAAQYIDALADLSRVSPNGRHTDLYDRFLGWPTALERDR